VCILTKSACFYFLICKCEQHCLAWVISLVPAFSKSIACFDFAYEEEKYAEYFAIFILTGLLRLVSQALLALLIVAVAAKSSSADN